MQVERDHIFVYVRVAMNMIQWRTGEEHVRTYLLAGDNNGKLLLIPHNAEERKGNYQKRGLRLIS